jgi:CHAT domain
VGACQESTSRHCRNAFAGWRPYRHHRPSGSRPDCPSTLRWHRNGPFPTRPIGPRLRQRSKPTDQRQRDPGWACCTRRARTRPFAVRNALHASAERMVDLANEKQLEFDRAEPGAADSDAFRRLLETTDLMKVLCHGQVTREDHQVVLVIDHELASPPGYSFGVTLETTQGHRFGRDQLAEQGVASRTIFLGACSGGIVSVGGLDERTSFASLLARAGTKSVVAPRWKIDAELALPVLDDTLSRFVDGMPLAKAVSTAAGDAMQRGVPAWQAYAFVVEGAWMGTSQISSTQRVRRPKPYCRS